jgi:hypothetical protein
VYSGGGAMKSFSPIEVACFMLLLAFVVVILIKVVL